MTDVRAFSQTSLGQPSKPRELEGHSSAYSWSCQFPGLVWVGDVTSAPCKSVLQYPADVQQGEQSQPHFVLIDRCENSTSLPTGVLEGVPLPSVCLEVQSAATQQYGNRALPGKYLLGVLVTVVDEVAGDFVFGPHGTIGRPQA